MRRSGLLFGVDNRPTSQFSEFLKDIGIPGANLEEIDEALQKRFFQKRQDGQPKERWELDKVQVSCPPDRFKQHLASCGFFNEIKPNLKNYTYAAWPGALAVRVAARLFDLINGWNNGVRWECTIVFGGKRPLQPEKESYEQCCAAFCADDKESSHFYELWDALNPQTELEIMQWGWEVSKIRGPFDWRQNARVVFVDAPMKPPIKEGGPPARPNTEDTVREWLKSNPQPGSMLLSCGAPYGMAIDEAFWMLLEPHGFTVETFGHAAPDLSIENFMREVAGCVNRIRRSRKL